MTETGSQEGCPFCERVVSGDYDRTLDPAIISFRPLRPVTTGHRLFVPHRHVVDASQRIYLTGLVFAAAANYASRRTDAYNLITSAGHEATQTVMHLHVHYVPRRDGDGLSLPWTAQLSEVSRGC